MENRNIEVIKKTQNLLDNYSQLDEPLLKAVICNESGNGVEIQPAFPKPNRRQRLRYAYIPFSGGSSADVQIATASSTKRIYLLNMRALNVNAVASTISIFDATSGSAPSTGSSNSLNNETRIDLPASATANSFVQTAFTFPIEFKKGIRATGGGSTQSIYLYVEYIEETIDSRDS